MAFTPKFLADLLETINGLLDRIPVEAIGDFASIEKILNLSLTKDELKKVEGEDAISAYSNDIKEMLDEGFDMYVGPGALSKTNFVASKGGLVNEKILEEARIEFNTLVHSRITAKISELAMLNDEQKTKIIEARTEKKQKTQAKRSEMQKHVAPQAGAPGHTMTENELLLEGQRMEYLIDLASEAELLPATELRVLPHVTWSLMTSQPYYNILSRNINNIVDFITLTAQQVEALERADIRRLAPRLNLPTLMSAAHTLNAEDVRFLSNPIIGVIVDNSLYEHVLKLSVDERRAFIHTLTQPEVLTFIQNLLRTHNFRSLLKAPLVKWIVDFVIQDHNNIEKLKLIPLRVWMLLSSDPYDAILFRNINNIENFLLLTDQQLETLENANVRRLIRKEEVSVKTLLALNPAEFMFLTNPCIRDIEDIAVYSYVLSLPGDERREFVRTLAQPEVMGFILDIFRTNNFSAFAKSEFIIWVVNFLNDLNNIGILNLQPQRIWSLLSSKPYDTVLLGDINHRENFLTLTEQQLETLENADVRRLIQEGSVSVQTVLTLNHEESKFLVNPDIDKAIRIRYINDPIDDQRREFIRILTTPEVLVFFQNAFRLTSPSVLLKLSFTVGITAFLKKDPRNIEILKLPGFHQVVYQHLYEGRPDVLYEFDEYLSLTDRQIERLTSPKIIPFVTTGFRLAIILHSTDEVIENFDVLQHYPNAMYLIEKNEISLKEFLAVEPFIRVLSKEDGEFSNRGIAKVVETARKLTESQRRLLSEPLIASLASAPTKYSLKVILSLVENEGITFEEVRSLSEKERNRLEQNPFLLWLVEKKFFSFQEIRTFPEDKIKLLKGTFGMFEEHRFTAQLNMDDLISQQVATAFLRQRVIARLEDVLEKDSKEDSVTSIVSDCKNLRVLPLFIEAFKDFIIKSDWSFLYTSASISIEVIPLKDVEPTVYVPKAIHSMWNVMNDTKNIDQCLAQLVEIAKTYANNDGHTLFPGVTPLQRFCKKIAEIGTLQQDHELKMQGPI